MLLTGEFADREATATAVRALRAKGFDPEAIDLYSCEPLELEPGLLDRPSRMSLAAVGGGVTVCLLAVAFVSYTQTSYPLITGGMPIFSLWATGVIFYEMTMLGAIAATFLMFLWESGLLGRRAFPAPEPLAGRIYLRVRCEPDQLAAAGQCLFEAGVVRVKKDKLP